MNQEAPGSRKTPEEPSGNVANLEAKQTALRDHFIGWQCRIRQLAVRNADARPTSGMRPSLVLGADDSSPGQITTLIIKIHPDDTIAQFRHMVRKTHDPAERRASALRFLAAAYYQRSREFSDRLTALFGPDSALLRQMLYYGRCRLDFSQYNQLYRIPCTIQQLSRQDAAYQATYWHNSLFNPYLPNDVQVLQFRPDWIYAQAEPPVG